MKKEDYKELNDKELLERLDAAEKEYVQTKIQHSISPLDNPAKITVDRRNIARMKTEVRAGELKTRLSLWTSNGRKNTQSMVSSLTKRRNTTLTMKRMSAKLAIRCV